MAVSRKNMMPGPDMSGTDPDKVLRSRVGIDLGVPIGSPPSPPTAPTALPARLVKRAPTRPDPKGMKRASLYIARDAYEALEGGADRILEILGDGTPRHEVLSALLRAGAAQAARVAQQLAAERAQSLADRIAQLQEED
ncbi:MAG: hypothetical protein H0T78_08545 [Longispora sp.]|nr:hypothetical protein [Longispora sp. (in: high G+C Gram-positive bacteria)]